MSSAHPTAPSATTEKAGAIPGEPDFPLSGGLDGAPALNGTPGDEHTPMRGPRKAPQRGIRKRVLGNGEGDYCIYRIAGKNEPDVPAGALIPIPDVPRFETTARAIQWIKNSSGDRLAGMQVMVFKAMDILSIQVASKPSIEVLSKPRVVVKDPTQGAGGDEGLGE